MQMFRGGIQDSENLVQVWNDPVRVFRAGLVSAVTGTPNPDWQYINQFVAANPLVPDALLPQIVTRTTESWNASTNRVNFRWTGKLSFGNPSSGFPFVGVVIYRDTGDQFTSPLYWYDDGGVGFPGETAGGQVTYGVDGTGNLAGYLEASVGGAMPLAGAGLDIVETAQMWATSAVFKLRLVRSGGTTVGNPDWVTLQDVINAGVQFASGTTDVNISQAVRTKGWELVDLESDEYQFAADPPAPYTFPAVPVGQTIVAVLMFRDTGVPSTSRVWHWDGAFAPVVTTGGDFIYGNGLRQVIQKIVA